MTANLLINYDLPWNPMKVEQRVGRIDRIGQRHDQIHVQNLCYVGSVEETVYGRLLQRLAGAAGVVGAQQVAMLPISEEDFRLLASGELSEWELEQQARERIELQKQRTASMEISAQDLYDIYVRMGQQQEKRTLPVSLDEICEVLTESQFLKEAGCAVSADGRLMTIKGLETVIEGALLTADRAIYDKGLPGISQPIHFASYGDPVFDALLEEICQFDLPVGCRKVESSQSNMPVSMSCYAVLTEGEKKYKLVTSLSATQGLALAEDPDMAVEPDIETCNAELSAVLTEEYSVFPAVKNIEQANIKAALAQQRLALNVAFHLISQGGMLSTDNFYSTVNGFNEFLESCDPIPVYNLNLTGLRQIEDDMVFDINIPQTGRVTTLTVPPLLAHAAVDTACRLADSMRKRRSEITIHDVRERLTKEIERIKFSGVGVNGSKLHGSV